MAMKKIYLKHLSVGDAWAHLLDVAGTEGLHYKMSSMHCSLYKKDIGQHFDAVGAYMKIALGALESESKAKEEAADREKQAHAPTRSSSDRTRARVATNS